MATLYIYFTEPTFPTPSQYKVRYKPTTSSTWTETIISGPAPLSIPGTTDSIEYDVEVYSDCGEGVFSAADTDIAPFARCNSYTFENTDSVSHDITYYPCGYNDVGVTVTAAAGETVGPFCIAIETTIIGSVLWDTLDPTVLANEVTVNCTTTTPTGE